MKKFFLLSLLATTTTIETWTMKNTRNHETMTVKKIGRRGAPKTFLLCALDTEKKRRASSTVNPNAGFDLMWPKNGGFPPLALHTTHIVCCNANASSLFFKPKTDVEKN